MADPLAPGDAYSFTPTQPFRVEVEEGKIHEFARATHSTSAAHLRPRDPVSPVTFLASSALWMVEANNAWRGITRNFRHILHGEQEFVFFAAPPPAGTTLTARQFVDRSYDKQGRRGGRMTFTEIVTRFWTADMDEDRPLVEMRSVSIRKHPDGGAPAPTVPAATVPAATTTAVRDAPHVERAALFEHTEPALTITDFVRYQGASGDFNPIHHDTEFATRAGYAGPFAVGMLTAAVAANLVTDRFGPTAVRRYRVRWQGQAWPGDALTYRGFAADGGISIVVTRADGTPHLTAEVTTA